MTKPADFMELWQSMSGVDLIKAIAAGQAPRAPHAEFIGLAIDDGVSGRVDLTWRPTPAVTNPQGNVHGGYVAMVLDDACCLAAVTLTDPFLPMLTLSLNIDYLRRVRPGESYSVTGTVVHSGRQRTVARAAIIRPDGKPIAEASGSVTPNRAFSPSATPAAGSPGPSAGPSAGASAD